MSAPSTIGERIKAVRLRAGLAQEAFGHALGYSRRAVINWEQGAAEPPVAILAELRRCWDVDPEWVVMGEDATPRSRYGRTDWRRLDRIERDVATACAQVGIDLEPQVVIELVRDLFDDDSGADEANGKQLRVMLRAMARGKSR